MEMSPVFPFCVPVTAGIVFVFMGNPNISTKLRISYYRRGQYLSPPLTVPALCDGVVITFSGIIAPGGCHSGGGGGITWP